MISGGLVTYNKLILRYVLLVAGVKIVKRQKQLQVTWYRLQGF